MRLGRLVDAAVVGYMLGTIPSADIAARRASGGSLDLREVGSGNPGATNALNVLGRKYGLAVLAADVGKGALAGFVGRLIARRPGSHLAATAAVVGHCLPVWSRFRGGKGVATSAGQCLSTFPAYFPLQVGVAGITVAMPWWKERDLAAVAASSAAWIVSALFWWRGRWHNAWGPKPSIGLPLAAAASSAIVIYKFMTAPADEPVGGDGTSGEAVA
jgi:glycerol-3-phosphate acyltransferase PlsY